MEHRGRFSEMGDPIGIAPLERDHAVLRAAENASRTRRTQALREVLDAVEQDIVLMGRQLGLEMPEPAELGTTATLKVREGGQEQPYGSLIEGEQLRQKIVPRDVWLRLHVTNSAESPERAACPVSVDTSAASVRDGLAIYTPLREEGQVCIRPHRGVIYSSVY